MTFRGEKRKKGTALFVAAIIVGVAFAPALVGGIRPEKVVDIVPVEPPLADPGAPITAIEGGNGIIDLFRDILQWVAIVFWIAAIGFVLYAAFLYLTAAGNTERTSKANKQFTFAVVAMIIGIIAYGLPAIVLDFLGGDRSGFLFFKW